MTVEALLRKGLFLSILTFFLGGVGFAQGITPSPTPPIESEDDWVCGLKTDLVKFTVSVWDPEEKKYINNLNHTDFEILENSGIREIEIFSRPPEEISSGDSGNKYMLGFALWDWKQDKWHTIKVRVKSHVGGRKFVVLSTPDRYFY